MRIKERDMRREKKEEEGREGEVLTSSCEREERKKREIDQRESTTLP